ncbi:ATPase, T2SS/T4P/T4SS family [Carnobacterium sp. FSL W8-0810]|uniref:ATPase, T2SS/T4P/T4SS family n=1 Tax=Carnobacterium sp. FSL W8-0810 TaxID=2954705 RepID=UPI0030F7B6A8
MEIEEFTQYVISKAQEVGTSDIHILPEEKQYHFYFRIGGKLCFWNAIPDEEGRRFISYFKYLSNMDVGERRKPQSGAAQLMVQGKKYSTSFFNYNQF